MNFVHIARKTLKDPAAIRRVEEANPEVKPISKDDIINIIIDLELNFENIFMKEKKVVRCKYIDEREFSNEKSFCLL